MFNKRKKLVNDISSKLSELCSLNESEYIDNKITLPKELIKDDYYYNELYSLSTICVDQATLENMFNFLRLRDLLGYYYNIFDFPEPIKSMWLQNMLIIMSSLIEATLKSAFQRLKMINDISNVQSKFDYKRMNKMFYSEMIDQAYKYGLLTVSKDILHEIREMRNNIHIYLNKKNVTHSKQYDTETINFVFEVFDAVVINISQNLKVLGG